MKRQRYFSTGPACSRSAVRLRAVRLRAVRLRAVRLPAVRLLGWLVLAISSPIAADEAPKAPSFDDSTTVVVVEVPVNVHLDGKVVRGLTRSDFEIYEGRSRRELVGFEVVDLAAGTGTPAAPAAEAQVPMAARRHFLLFFDLTAGGLAGLQGARDLVDSGLHAQDLVGVGVYSRAGAGLLLGFTPDHGQVRAVLDRLGAESSREEGDSEQDGAALARLDPLKLTPDTRAIDTAREALEMDTGGRGSGAEVFFEMNRSNINQGRSRARAEVGRFSDALSTLADATARIDGRKFLVLFSAGFDDDVFFEEETLTRRSLLDSRQGSTALRDLQRMTDRFRKAGWAIQSVDSAGLQEGRNLSGGTSLALLANETGGETYRSFNHLSGAMNQLLDKTSVTYLLAFRADNVAMDGSFHKIKVRLPNGPRGARLIHRPGYYAPKSFDSEGDEGIDAAADRFSAAEMLLSGERSGSLKVNFLSASFRHGDAGRTFTWLDVTGLDALPSDKPFKIEIFAYVLDRAQRVVDFSVRALTLDPAKVGERLAAGGLRALTDFALPAGEYDLRLLAREPESGLHGLVRGALEVPPGEGQNPSLLPPFLLDDELNGVVVRPPADEANFNNYPFVAGEAESFVPGVDPALNPGQSVRVCLMGYHLNRADLTLKVEIYDVTDHADGERIDQERVELVGRSETLANGLDRLYFNLKTAGLAGGRYELRASIESTDSGFQVVASPFRIDG